MITAHRPGAATPTRLYPSTTTTYANGLDYIAIEHAMNGEPATLTLPERVEAARQLNVRGIEHAEISRRLHRDRATITAWQKNGWIPPAQLIELEPIDIGAATHGRSGYTKGCRCGTCRAGALAYNRARRAAKAAAA
ncbi:hypothetical protein ACFYPA_06435 [Streptomyces sp. NPDC005775]|uniref:hypothetical protein n=1 Tax=Streptomyces sp. NPDC005775 TaxID=3364729 RepID=UPI0036A26DEE